MLTKRVKSKLAAGLMLALATTPALAVDWKHLSSSAEESFYVDPASIKKVDGAVQAWMLIDSEQREPEFGSQSYVWHMRFRCADDEAATRTFVMYEERMGMGKVISTIREDSWKFTSVIPGSLNAAMLQEVCALASSGR